MNYQMRSTYFIFLADLMRFLSFEEYVPCRFHRIHKFTLSRHLINKLRCAHMSILLKRKKRYELPNAFYILYFPRRFDEILRNMFHADSIVFISLH
jgi:hypothetical protein